VQRLVNNPWIRLDKRNEDRSEFGIPPRELDGKGGKDGVKIAPVLEVSRTEEGGTELPLCEQPLRDCLCDRALSCSRQPVEPVDGGFVEVPRPVLDLI